VQIIEPQAFFDFRKYALWYSLFTYFLTDYCCSYAK